MSALITIVRARVREEAPPRGVIVAAGDPLAFAELAEAHRVLPLVADAAHALDEPGASILRSYVDVPARQVAARALGSLPRLRELLRALRSVGITAMPWKGPVLALQAWANIAARSFTDLDLVVRPADRHRARDVLRGLGWRPRHAMRDAQEDVIFGPQRAYEFARGDDPLFVELHWAFGARRYSGYPPVDAVISRAVTIDGLGAPLPAASPADALALHAVHACKHGWSTLEDVAVFARLSRDAQVVAEAMDIARECGALRPLTLGISLAERTLGERHDGEGNAAPADPAIAALVDQVMSRWMAGDTAWRSTLRWDLAWTDGVARRARLLAHSAFDPTLQEWNAVRLPSGLGPLYRVIRPVRLLARAIRGLVRR